MNETSADETGDDEGVLLSKTADGEAGDDEGVLQNKTVDDEAGDQQEDARRWQPISGPLEVGTRAKTTDYKSLLARDIGIGGKCHAMAKCDDRVLPLERGNVPSRVPDRRAEGMHAHVHRRFGRGKA